MTDFLYNAFSQMPRIDRQSRATYPNLALLLSTFCQSTPSPKESIVSGVPPISLPKTVLHLIEESNTRTFALVRVSSNIPRQLVFSKIRGNIQFVESRTVHKDPPDHEYYYWLDFVQETLATGDRC